MCANFTRDKDGLKFIHDMLAHKKCSTDSRLNCNQKLLIFLDTKRQIFRTLYQILSGEFKSVGQCNINKNMS